jgi:hypothetical protein
VADAKMKISTLLNPTETAAFSTPLYGFSPRLMHITSEGIGKRMMPNKISDVYMKAPFVVEYMPQYYTIMKLAYPLRHMEI